MTWWNLLIYAFAGIGALGVLPNLFYYLIAWIFDLIFN